MDIFIEPMLEQIHQLLLPERVVEPKLYIKRKGIRQPLLELVSDCYIKRRRGLESVKYNTILNKGVIDLYNIDNQLLCRINNSSDLLYISQTDTTEPAKIFKDYITYLHMHTIIDDMILEEAISKAILPKYITQYSTFEGYLRSYPNLSNYSIEEIKHILDNTTNSILRGMVGNMLYKVDITEDIIKIYPYINIYEAVYRNIKLV